MTRQIRTWVSLRLRRRVPAGGGIGVVMATPWQNWVRDGWSTFVSHRCRNFSAANPTTGRMHYDEIEHLRARHAAWTLLGSRNVALVLSFLGRVFVDANASNLPESVVVGQLDDELFALNQRLGDNRFPRRAKEYLDDWSTPERAWLRRYYPPGSDEPHYDLTPAVEKALAWANDLAVRSFIGTESRLNTVFELLRQMVFGADADPAQRLADLQRRRDAIDAEIARVASGRVDLADPVVQRDRYQQFARTARELLADFRQVEENFRELDRRLREQIAGWSGSKGELLEDLFVNQKGIDESDQGRSFRAFYDLLLSADRQAELTDLLSRLPGIDSLDEYDPRLERVHFDWIDASERTQATVRLLSEQLRRFLDDQVWLENRRVFDLLRGIEAKALRLAGEPAPPIETAIDATKVPVVLPMERPLYRRSRTTPLDGGPLEAADDDIDSSAMFDQLHVDREALARSVLTALGPHRQVSLEHVVADTPIEQGLAELLAYLSLSEPGLEVVFDDDGRARVAWVDHDDGTERVADMPRVTFARVVEEPA